MRSTTFLRWLRLQGILRLGVLAAVLLGAALASSIPARAQTNQMVLQANELIYDYDSDMISAVGDVFVQYRLYILTADRLTFFQSTGRLVAVGNVRITDGDGNVYEAAQADVTQDFREGFIQQLYVVTADRTFFSAETSYRYDGNITEFHNATYTACEVRFEHESRPRLWEVRAARIVHDGEEQMVYFEHARLEFLGVPVAYSPRLSTPDPSVTRATGFLFPEVNVSSSLGFGIGIPFFWAPAPNYDLTITGTYFTKAGFLLETEWRHRTQNGIYRIISAGIYEKAPSSTFRGAVRTTGEYSIGRFWQFGWDGTIQTDRSFTGDYSTVAPGGRFVTSEVYLTGVINQTYYNAAAYYFQNVDDPSPRNDQARQAVVHPVIDFQHVMPFFGGQLTYDANVISLTRGEHDPFDYDGDTYYHGLAGSYNRLSQQLFWQRQFIGPFGQLVTPFVFGVADLYVLDLDAPPPGVITDSFAARITGGLGVEWSWPFLITTANSRHVIEPVVQFVTRPSEAMIGALPNEDAQSVIFDTTSLASINRFSGWDRFEGGTRLVLLLRYTGQIGSGRIEAVIGQSFQLAGVNSYAVAGVNSTGMGTGLESDMSNIVAALTATSGRGSSLSVAGRFDPITFELQRGLLTAATSIGRLSMSTGLIYERSVLDIEGDDDAAFLITGRAAIDIGRYWTLSGTIDYDAIAGYVVADSVGLRYECDCALFSVVYSEERELGLVVDRSILFNLQLRTLGDFDITRR